MGQTQYISKGAKVMILDMRLKDRGMTNLNGTYLPMMITM